MNSKARFQPLAGGKGHSYRTSKRLMKGGVIVWEPPHRWDEFPNVCQRITFPHSVRLSGTKQNTALGSSDKIFHARMHQLAKILQGYKWLHGLSTVFYMLPKPKATRVVTPLVLIDHVKKIGGWTKMKQIKEFQQD